ncbi:MAG: nucleotidyltransferase domain-containing protein [Xanthomonadales bacterium]|nr:nucleotidyltransferase domain-containing protein [Xanthomonadales bacterium]
MAAALADVLSRYPALELAFVFGSVARGTASCDSDLDIAVQARTPLDAATRIRLIEDLAESSGRAIDLIDLRQTGEPLRGEVLRHGRRILGSDAALAELMSRRVHDMEDFVPYVQRMLQERNRAWTR